jgi:hypothetical protein
MVYRFLAAKFFHVYIHQQWLEGAFNILNHCQTNDQPELMAAKLLTKRNHTTDVVVDGKLMDKEASARKKAKTETNKNDDLRHTTLLDDMTSKPTLQRKKAEDTLNERPVPVQKKAVKKKAAKKKTPANKTNKKANK